MVLARRSAALSILSLAIGLSLTFIGALSAEPVKPGAKGETKAEQLVQSALNVEASGAPGNRERLLSDAVRVDPACAAAHWHSGEVLWKKQWVSAGAVPELVLADERIAAYHKVRDSYPDTVAGQLDLADWCSKRGLGEQERAHLTRVLELSPDHEAARERLGFRRVDGAWLSREEVADSAARSRGAVRDLATWRPRLEKIRDGLTQAVPARRQAAEAKLLEVTDVAAIPALELTFGEQSESISKLLVRVLAGMKSGDATLALARQAVYSPWRPVRDAAIAELKNRPLDAFVPTLLSAMYTPVETQANLFRAPGGRLLYRQSFYREGQQAKELTVLDTAYHLVSNTTAGSTHVKNQAAVDAANKVQQSEQATARQNTATSELNERIAAVLNAVTGQLQSARAEAWWQWWNLYNEVYSSDEKSTRENYAAQQITYADITATGGPSGGSGGGGGYGPPVMDCLAAGTPVYTARGRVAIEKMHVGDLVLSQNPETGELAYKPVLKTTIRPVSSLVTLKLGSEMLSTSGGHLFWANGQGWFKARRIAEGITLHSLRGPVVVEAVEDGDVAHTYNLVVADFHTFFVGESQVLNHDNTVRLATEAIVPGLKP